MKYFEKFGNYWFKLSLHVFVFKPIFTPTLLFIYLFIYLFIAAGEVAGECMVTS